MNPLQQQYHYHHAHPLPLQQPLPSQPLPPHPADSRVYLPPVTQLVNHPVAQQQPPPPPPADDDNSPPQYDSADVDAQQDEPSPDPAQPRPLEPVGALPAETIYDSQESLFHSVHAWGSAHGIDLVRRKAKSTKKGLPPYRWMMVCARSGKKDTRNGRGIRKRGSMKCDCPFRFHCVAVNPQNPTGEYRVTLAGGDSTRHNHPTAAPDSLNGARRRARRQQADHRLAQIKNLRKIGVPDAHMTEYLGEAGSPAQISDLSELIWRVD